MEENRIYELDLEGIKSDWKFKKEEEIIPGQFNLSRHYHCIKFKLLPYVANDKKVVSTLDGVIGEFSRIICDKKLKDVFETKEFIENICDEIEEFESEDSKQNFKNIINTMYINNNKLVNFDIKTINYIESTSGEEKYARFLFSIFIDNEIKEKAKEYYNKDNNNILNRLVLRALPQLKDTKSANENYKCYLPYIKELFKRDFMFILQDEELYKNSIKRFLDYYNMFYVSQLCMKLIKFENADLTKSEPLYYTLGWESTSKNRTAYKYGYEKLKESMKSLFSHVVTLELLNNVVNNNEQFGYVELYKTFQENNSEKIAQNIEQLLDEYKKRVCDVKWDEFKVIHKDSNNIAFSKVYELFDTLEYQFSVSTRGRAYEAYKNWFKNFIEANFGKRRGSLGYTLSLNEEDIILLTKICINTNEKLKLSTLFEEFEKRGVYLDRDSRTKVIQLYEKLNILEKKSDSGDAQYVRSIL